MYRTMRSDIDQVIRLLKADYQDALDKAISLLQQSVFSFSMRVCGQQEDAEDTMQEVLVKAIPYLPNFENSGALAKWLYKVAKNRCLMSRRRSKFAPKQELSLEELMPEREELERLDLSEEISPEDSAIRGEKDQRLRRQFEACRLTIALSGFCTTWKASQMRKPPRLRGCVREPFVYACSGLG